MLNLLQCVAAGVDNTEIKSVQQKENKRCFFLFGLYFPFMTKCALSIEWHSVQTMKKVEHALVLLRFTLKIFTDNTIQSQVNQLKFSYHHFPLKEMSLDISSTTY